MEEKFAAFIGLDWGDKAHSASLQEVGQERIDRYVIEQSAEAIQQWVLRLRRRFAGQKVAVMIERSNGALVYALMGYDFLVLYPVNPRALARYRDTFRISGAKDDVSDADLALDLLSRHYDRLDCWKPDRAELRALAILVEQRRKLVDERTRLTNRLQQWLKEYFPQLLRWFASTKDPVLWAFLKRWPTLQSAQRAHRSTIEKFLRKHKKRKVHTYSEQIAEAVPLTDDEAVLMAHPELAQIFAAQLQTLEKSIHHIDDKIARLFASLPQADFFSDLPGAGPALAPRLAAVFGSDPQRWTAHSLACFAGIAPITKQSGNTKIVSRRFACPTFLLQTFHEFAANSLPYCRWAHASYQLQRARGSGHHAAVRRVAFQWIRILTACWRNGTPYDEETYHRALKRRNSPVWNQLQENKNP